MSTAPELSEAEALVVSAFGLDKPEPAGAEGLIAEVRRVIAEDFEYDDDPFPAMVLKLADALERSDDHLTEVLAEVKRLVNLPVATTAPSDADLREALTDKLARIYSPGAYWNLTAEYPTESRDMAEAGVTVARCTVEPMVDAILPMLSRISQPSDVTGAGLIAAERERQVTEEGYTAVHDAGRAHQLANAAVSYGAFAQVTLEHGLTPEQARESGAHVVPPMWPWSSHYWKPTGDPVRDLTKAGALVAAAIDSIAAPAASTESEGTNG